LGKNGDVGLWDKMAFWEKCDVGSRDKLMIWEKPAMWDGAIKQRSGIV
jgi:hypothetical protein